MNNKKRNVRTLVAIIKVRLDSDSTFHEAFLGGQSTKLPKLKFDSSDLIPVDVPMLIIPSGDMESVEIIPIRERAVLHSKGMKRTIVP